MAESFRSGQYNPNEDVNRSVVNAPGSQVDASRNIRMIDERTAAFATRAQPLNISYTMVGLVCKRDKHQRNLELEASEILKHV